MSRSDNDTARYALPVAVEWTRYDRTTPEAKAALIAPVRRVNREGVLVEAIANRALVSALARNIHAGGEMGADGARIVFPAFASGSRRRRLPVI